MGSGLAITTPLVQRVLNRRPGRQKLQRRSRMRSGMLDDDPSQFDA
jgi:hypothetical protein